MRKIKFWQIVLVGLLVIIFGGLFALSLRPAYATLGWVGNMNPVGGTLQTVTPNTPVPVQIEVHKGGVTDSGGQGAGIECYLHWGLVDYFGGHWVAITDTQMTYDTDTGNNDVYKTNITPPLGKYEFTAYCVDTTDDSTLWNQDGLGNSQLVVNTSSGTCNTSSQGDDNIFWNGLLHDSFNTLYRAPIGPVDTEEQTVTLKLRTCMSDLDQEPHLRVWDDYIKAEHIYTMTFDSYDDGGGEGGVMYWRYDLSIPITPTILYYAFKIQDGTDTDYYRDDDPQFYGGGYGTGEDDENTAYNNSYQITVYDPNFTVPEWMQRGIVYQVFPDRFRDGDVSNNPTAGRFSYNRSDGAITRSHTITNAANSTGAWNFTVCDPRDTYSPGCTNYYGDNFYGGDLRGIIDKIEDGYFDALGVSVLYLNPIFRAPSNHKYDTSDYMTIDPDFGTLSTFQALAAAAKAHGIRIILDGVFNHTSSDSTYFDLYKRYASDGTLTSPNNPGTDDGSGACESPNSTYRNWYYLPDTGTPPNDPSDRCDGDDNDDPGGAWNVTYESWWGYGSLPKLQANSASVRALIWDDGLNSVGPYWVNQGAAGWRFDVGDDVDPGLHDPTNDYWEGFRAAVREEAVTGRADTLMLGELWGDASGWLLGNEWDSVMNYRFRSALFGWLFTGCSGNGCGNDGTDYFEDNDNNMSSSGGEIRMLTPSQFNARLLSIWEDYPPMAWKAMMNLEGSHDTNRVRFLLKKINNDNDSAALQRMKEWWLFAFTYAGAPTLYYGDEIALNHDGTWANNKWEDDPYNRVPYPWPDAEGNSYVPVTDTLHHARKMASVRLSYQPLQDGDVHHGLVIDDANKLYGFGRTLSQTGMTTTALVLLNRDNSGHEVTLSDLNAAPYYLSDSTQLYDVIEGETYTVTGGAVTVTVNSNWGVVLLEEDKIDVPVAPSLSITQTHDDAMLSWPLVVTDTSGGRELATHYEVHRSTNATFTPDASTLIDTVTPAPYGSSDGRMHYADAGAAEQSYYYIVRASTASGTFADSSAQTPRTDLSLTKRLLTNPAHIVPGHTVTYTLVFTNVGPSVASNITLSDNVPLHVLTHVTYCASLPITHAQGSTYTWTIHPLSPGERGLITITGLLTQPLAQGIQFTNTASLTVTIPDIDTANNAAAVRATTQNKSPVANDDEDTTNEHTPITLMVLENDEDANGDTLTVASVTQPANGSVTHQTTHLTYTPTNQAATYTATFSYTVTDSALVDTARVTLHVDATDDAPTISNIPNQSSQDGNPVGPISFTINDIDTLPDTLTLDRATSNPGLVPLTNITFGGSGTARTVTVTPTTDASGTAQITITVSDGTSTASDSFVIAVAVNSPPEFDSAPVTSATVGQAYVYEVRVSDADHDPVTLTARTIPAWPDLTLTGDYTATLHGTPTSEGHDSVILDLSDGQADMTQAFSITVSLPPNQPPIARAGSDRIVGVGQSVMLDGHASEDPDNHLPLTYGWRQLAGLNIVLDDATAMRPTFTAPATPTVLGFALVVTDSQGIASPLDTVIITVTTTPPPNHPPTTQNDAAVTTAGHPVTITVLRNDTDEDGDPLTVLSVGASTYGTPTHTSTNITYHPYEDFVGTDTFTYTISDGQAAATAHVSITVAHVQSTISPDAPALTTYTTPDGEKTVLTLPSGAVTSTLDLLYTELERLGTAPTSYHFAGRAFRLDAYQNGQRLDTFTFQKPIVVTLRYREEDVAGLDLDTLHIFYFDTATQTWHDNTITPMYHDQANRSITFSFTHLTDFALFAQAQTAAPQLQISKTVNEGPPPLIQPGDIITYTIVISNTGAEIAHQVIMTDPLPTDIVFGAFVGGWPASVAQPLQNHTLHWTANAFPDGAQSTLTFTATVAPTATVRCITNTAYLNAIGMASRISAAASLTLTYPSSNTAPKFTSEPLTQATVGAPYTYTITTDDAEKDPVTISWATLVTPTWLMLTDHHNGTADLTGTPTASDMGTQTLKLQAHDGLSTTVQTFTLTVNKVEWKVYLPVVLKQ